MSSVLLKAVEAIVPPEPVTWKNSSSANSQASTVCATNTGSMCVYWRRSPCTTQKKNVFDSCRSCSVMLEDTSIVKNTTASVLGCVRTTSWR